MARASWIPPSPRRQQVHSPSPRCQQVADPRAARVHSASPAASAFPGAANRPASIPAEKQQDRGGLPRPWPRDPDRSNRSLIDQGRELGGTGGLAGAGLVGSLAFAGSPPGAPGCDRRAWLAPGKRGGESGRRSRLQGCRIVERVPRGYLGRLARCYRGAVSPAVFSSLGNRRSKEERTSSEENSGVRSAWT